MRSVLLLLLGFLALSGCAGQDAACLPGEAAAVLPLRFLGKVPVLEAEINGRAAVLLLDTGADRTVLSRAAAARLGVAVAGGTRRMVGAGGLAEVTEARVGRLVLGGAVLRDQAVAVSAGLPGGVDGLLGLDVLSGFEMDFDPAAGRAMLHPARRCVATRPGWGEGGMAVLIRREPSGQLFTNAVLDGDTLLGLLDTGATGSVLSLQAAEGLGVGPRRLRSLPGGVSAALNAEGMAFRVRPFGSLAVAGVRLERPVLAIADLPAVAGSMVVGMDVLGARRWWFAFLLGRVWVRAPG